MKSDSEIIQDQKTVIDGLSVYYKLVGDPQKLPLVFLHGHPMPHAPASTFDYSNVLLELARYFYVIAPEHIATMRSDPPKGKFDMRERARHLDRFLQRIEVDNFVLMGQSFGGGVALVYTSLFPNKVKALILVDALSNYLQRAIFIVNTARFIIYKLLHSLRLTLKHFYFVSDKIPWNREKVEFYIESINPRYRYINVDYQRIKTPTLIIWGNKDWFLTPIWGAFEMKRGIPDSKLIIVNGGHTILYQNPEYVVKKLVGTLREDS